MKLQLCDMANNISNFATPPKHNDYNTTPTKTKQTKMEFVNELEIELVINKLKLDDVTELKKTVKRPQKIFDTNIDFTIFRKMLENSKGCEYFDINLETSDEMEQPISLVDIFDSQPNINAKMFVILINWLVQVHSKFKMMPETLYLTQQVIARYMSVEHTIKRSHLQLVGIAALFMSAKYEEIYSPEIKDLIFICDKAYSRQEIIDMEWTILQKFNFNLLCSCTIHSYICFYSLINMSTKQEVQCVCYLCELTLLHEIFFKYKPSVIVASAIAIARDFVKKVNTWIDILQYYTRYDLTDLQQCICDFKKIIDDKTLGASVYKLRDSSTYNKYSAKKFDCIATKFDAYEWKKVIL